MSVGHIARLLEGAGIPTVIVAAAAFAERLKAMTLPRVLLTPHLMGRPMGPPGHAARQHETLAAAFELLEQAEHPGTVVRMPGSYRPA
ncbi:MAG: hypothetical protein WD535_04015 [Thermaerobacterales bacterium]